LGKRFRGSATKFRAYGSPVFAPDIDPTPCFSRDIAAQSVCERVRVLTTAVCSGVHGGRDMTWLAPSGVVEVPYNALMRGSAQARKNREISGKEQRIRS